MKKAALEMQDPGAGGGGGGGLGWLDQRSILDQGYGNRDYKLTYLWLLSWEEENR